MSGLLSFRFRRYQTSIRELVINSSHFVFDPPGSVLICDCVHLRLRGQYREQSRPGLVRLMDRLDGWNPVATAPGTDDLILKSGHYRTLRWRQTKVKIEKHDLTCKLA